MEYYIFILLFLNMFNGTFNFNFASTNLQSIDDVFIFDTSQFQSIPSYSSINNIPEIKEEGKIYSKDNNITPKFKIKIDDNLSFKEYNKFNKDQNNSVAPNNQGDKGPRDNKEFKGPKDNNQAENQGHGGKKGYNKFPKKDENVHNNAGNNNMNRKGKKFYPQNHRKSGNRGDK